MVLVDTSVWIEAFRRGSPLRLDALVDLDDVVTCAPVVQEVIQGFDEDRAFRLAREAMLAFPILEDPMSVNVYEHAAELFRRGRRLGRTIRSGVDCVIAACALRHDAELLHCDRDFDRIASYTPLRARAIRPITPR
jgi:predicted nucleic acid-binding protein